MAIVKQPEPIKEITETPIVMLVIRDLLDRGETGLARYGTLLTSGNGRDHLVDAYQEALDLCCYLRAEIDRRERIIEEAHYIGGPVDLVNAWGDEVENVGVRCEQD